MSALRRVAGGTPSAPSPGRPVSSASRATTPATRSSAHVDAKVAARNAALNVAGGVKVDVFIRVRPHVSEDGESPDVVQVDNNEVALKEEKSRMADVFKFDKVFPQSCSNEELFGTAMQGIVDQVARGLSSCVFAYGQTGSGKTYTMRGTLAEIDDPKHYGLIQRSVSYLMDSMRRTYPEVKLRVSMLEVYNEQLEDLFIPTEGSVPAGLASPTPATRGSSARPTAPTTLDSNIVPFDAAKEVITAIHKAAATAPAPGTTAALKELVAASNSGGAFGVKPLTLVDHPERGTLCVGLSEVEVGDVEQVVWLLKRAEERSRFTATAMNKASNRAHRIFTVIAQFKRGDSWFTTSLTLVDLAGSEDISRSGATGVAAKEASHINKSLLTLGRVINALASNSPHIPYRESKLTRLLSEALGGVCKTTFIACVSPAASSATETASTLRYAKRASEALNISQLPRWQQDEILIEGLTRRVQMLEAELSSKDSTHMKELASVQTKLDAARRDNATLMDHLARAKSHVQKLCEQQLAARTALHVVTVHRDRLEGEKAALKNELLETRSARDGFLADRSALVQVLSSVRATRESLLAAYKEVENKLSTDCSTLKATMERALTDIDGLHGEISRKRQISVFNEGAADVFCDDMTTKFRQVLDAVFQFRDAQSDRHANAMEGLTQMSVEREHHAGEVQAEVRKLVHATIDILTGLSETVSAAEVQAQARSLRQREDVRSSSEGVVTLLGHLREHVDKSLTSVRNQCNQLDDSLRTWSTKVQSRFDAFQTSTANFTKRLTDDLFTLQSSMSDAHNSQLARLQEHEKALENFKVSEQNAINSSSQRLIQELSTQIARALNDNASEACRRLERSAGVFRDETQSIAGDVREASKTYISQNSIVMKEASAQGELVAQEVVDAKKQSQAAYEASIAVVSSVQNATKALESDTSERVMKTAGRLQSFAKEFADASLEGDAAVQKVTHSVKETVTAGSSASTATADAICSLVTEAAESFVASAGESQSALEERLSHLQEFTDTAVADTKDQEAHVNIYVHSTIKRDTQPDPRVNKYTYPTTFAAMAKYKDVITMKNPDLTDSWDLEEGIREGKLLPGAPSDFPGQKGIPDTSGILTSPRAHHDLEAILARLRDRTAAAIKPDLSSLDTAALKRTSSAVVEEVESVAKGFDAELEVWFSSMGALLSHFGSQDGTSISGILTVNGASPTPAPRFSSLSSFRKSLHVEEMAASSPLQPSTPTSVESKEHTPSELCSTPPKE